ncbi:MAG TPA: Ig-like domain-containing protein, partial [Rhodanobacteraceae bacterium]|nr:Ig-like domain-containing protein [Rhodanobacteraceae bacterium]
MSRFFSRAVLGAVILSPTLAHAIAVNSTTPHGNANNVSRSGAISIDFDTPLATSTITSSSFRVWGNETGRVAGTIEYSNNDKTLTFTPSGTYFPGEWVTIQLSHAIQGADSSSLRSAGYAFQFMTATSPGSLSFTELESSPVSVRLNGDT